MNNPKMLVDVASELIDELDSVKNGDIDVKKLTAYSTKIFWWKCKKCGHEWQTTIKHRYQGHGCPECAKVARSASAPNKQVLSDTYNLQVVNPKLAREWNYEKNESLVPKQISPMSHQKIWWKCAKGHEWQAVISSRSQGAGCPYCYGRKPIIGVNDLPTTNPDLMKEWDYDRNNGIDAHSLMQNSHKKAWWKCRVCGNEWQAFVSDRTRGNGCPACTFSKRTSQPVQIIYYYIREAFSDDQNSFRPKWLNRSGEIDIYIPSLHLGIEYDGERWHKDVDKDIQKDNMVLAQGIQMVRFREIGCPKLENSSSIISLDKPDTKWNYLRVGIETLFSFIQEKYSVSVVCPKIDFSTDMVKILSSYEGNKKSKSLASMSPQIAATWNYVKNEGLNPENIANQSNKKVWWKCDKCGYDWETTVNNRIKRGCPVCSNKEVWPGHNDLATVYPEMAKDWDYKRNGKLRPEMFTAGSYQIVWWKCPVCEYKWQSKIYDRKRSYDRNKGEISCPACAGKHIWKGYNDLLSQNPNLASEWCDEKNIGLHSDEITLGSNKPVWWKCSICHHIWKTSVYNRAKLHSGCPKCMRKEATKKLGVAVKCNETGKVYYSYSEAGRDVNRSGSSIKACIDKKTATCAGLHWSLIE